MYGCYNFLIENISSISKDKTLWLFLIIQKSNLKDVHNIDNTRIVDVIETCVWKGSHLMPKTSCIYFPVFIYYCWIYLTLSLLFIKNFSNFQYQFLYIIPSFSLWTFPLHEIPILVCSFFLFRQKWFKGTMRMNQWLYNCWCKMITSPNN